jgi:AcrR family transcriptional regulator
LAVNEKNDGSGIRKPRADAERNRARLLDAAKAVFTDKGSQSSLEEIARNAGVGIGTLYRHFPTRDALVEAVYRNESEQLAGAATDFANRHPPVEALRQWMFEFIEHMDAKHGMSEALNTLVGGPSELYAASTGKIRAAMDLLIGRAVDAGEITLDIDPLDLLRALAGIANIGAGPDWKPAARQLVDIMIAGMRTKSGS